MEKLPLPENEPAFVQLLKLPIQTHFRIRQQNVGYKVTSQIVSVAKNMDFYGTFY